MLLNGPNLNMLGQRETEHYGTRNLEDIERELGELASASGHELVSNQTNSESKLLGLIQSAPKDSIGLILINAGALTHTSIALRDALLAVAIPFIEIHLSNIFAREPFRHHSYLSNIAVGLVCGFGAQSYRLALDAAMAYLQDGGTPR